MTAPFGLVNTNCVHSCHSNQSDQMATRVGVEEITLMVATLVVGCGSQPCLKKAIVEAVARSQHFPYKLMKAIKDHANVLEGAVEVELCTRQRLN